MVEATGNPAAGIAHALAAIEAGTPIVMVNVEADVLAGPLLARKARDKGVVYSMAYGDQPALIAEQVDWARSSGFEVVAAGKGTKYLPAYHTVTPDGVWQHYGLTPEEAKKAGMNPQMFNSFLDGTKSALEMAAVANACGLKVPKDGLSFPPCGVDHLAEVLKGRDNGGQLAEDGMVEVVSSLERDGRPVFRDLRWGVYVVFKAPNDYAAACFRQYGMTTDRSGRYAALYRPYHLIGLELSISVLNAVLNKQPTGATRCMARRRGGGGQTRAEGRRDARRRGRFHGLRQADPGGTQPSRERAADRPRPRRQAPPRYPRRRHRRRCRRIPRRDRARSPCPSRDGSGGRKGRQRRRGLAAPPAPYAVGCGASLVRMVASSTSISASTALRSSPPDMIATTSSRVISDFRNVPLRRPRLSSVNTSPTG